jgi:transposase InsO family protein
VELLPLHFNEQETFVVHANAVLTPRGRLLLARRVVDEGWPIVRAAEHFHVSWPTAKRWASRYAAMGPEGMADRSSRPHRCPHRTPLPVVRKIIELRWRRRLSPLAIASRLSMAASTVHAVLVRCRLNRLSHIDIRTGEPIRRYEHEYPGAMIHVDVKKLGNIPTGGGWRFVGRAQGGKNRRTTAGTTRDKHHHELLGHGFVHTVIDDHSRVAYAEIHQDETAATAIAVLRRAVEWFRARDVTVIRVLSDNGACYRSFAWRDACAELRIKHVRTRPYRPQTNGKIERFHRTMANEWAFARHYRDERTRRSALPGWLHTYNHHRQHSAIGKVPPITRLTNLPGQYN